MGGIGGWANSGLVCPGWMGGETIAVFVSRMDGWLTIVVDMSRMDGCANSSLVCPG